VDALSERKIESLRSISLKVAAWALGPGTDATPGENASAEAEFIRLAAEFRGDDRERDLMPAIIAQASSLGNLFKDLQGREKSRSPRKALVNREFDDWLERHRLDAAPGPAIAPAFDWKAVQQDWERATAELVTDPSNAMTSAVSALESVLKHVVEKSGGTVREGQKLHELWYDVRQILSRTLPPGPRSTALLNALQGLSDAVSALGALRNKVGSAHGRGQSHVPATRAEASLVVYGAGAIGKTIRDAFGE
jgi:hypothetical protein